MKKEKFKKNLSLTDIKKFLIKGIAIKNYGKGKIPGFKKIPKAINCFRKLGLLHNSHITLTINSDVP